ncbi:MAG: hypothetical protein KJ622_05150 [Alphaproteobacteria bacterium]|nr:hypothetical protein [Alphaproteobacteria bacterium]
MTLKRQPAHEPADPARPDRPAIDESIEAEIGEKLREAFADVFNEPVPERFHALIRSLAGGTHQ